MKKGKLQPEPDHLRDVPGFVGRYAVSFEGVIYRRWQTGITPLLPVTKRGGPVVRLTRSDGKRQEMLVCRVVQLAWLGPVPEGKVRYHKNGVKEDNMVSNIGFICQKELGRRTGAMAKRRPVVKLCSEGEPVDVYPSARQAAKENYMSYQTVIDRCNGKVKNPLAPDGYRYEWEEREDAGTAGRGRGRCSVRKI